eukprot:TRINITY_DN1290_c0_g1_i1.p1 TRINITY_DN1290_c0_g1~~TRINITY_DN1290_c0_g1_i1.p1  ORF type:complete len:270 (-),score=59.48 TRINITY_DN1290_c0_g1_i1:136-945(-)
MKASIFCFVLLSAVVAILAASTASAAPAKAKQFAYEYQLSLKDRKALITHKPNLKEVPGFRCDVCIQFAVEGINILLNYILDSVIIGDCSDLCGQLSKIGKIEVDICDAFCDSMGVAEFVDLLKKFSNDIDPIYFCQLVDLCEVQDCTSPPCVTIPSFTIEPQVGNEKSTFLLNATAIVTQPVGAGMVLYEFASSTNPDQTFEFDSLITEYIPGEYKFDAAVSAEGYGYQITPGNWTVGFTLCEGMCGSTFPNTAVLAQSISWLVVEDY